MWLALVTFRSNTKAQSIKIQWFAGFPWLGRACEAWEGLQETQLFCTIGNGTIYLSKPVKLCSTKSKLCVYKKKTI